MEILTQKSTHNYQNLIVYRKSVENSIILFEYYKKNKVSWVEQFLIRQILRAATSIGANISEGYGRMHKKDYRRFLAIARGSSFEVQYWANLIIKIRPSDNKVLTQVLLINGEVGKMLTTLMKNLDK